MGRPAVQDPDGDKVQATLPGLVSLWLREQAARHGNSVSAEVRDIVTQARAREQKAGYREHARRLK